MYIESDKMKTGKIYKIIHNQSNIVYVGSTYNTLRDRWYKHKSNYNNYLKEKSGEIAIYPYFKNYGIENFKIILIKEYKVIDRKHLSVYETLWIKKLNTINKNSPFRIKKIWRKQYHQLHKEENNKKSKKYCENNPEKIKESQKLYRENNPEKIKESQKLYREINKDKEKERVKKWRENNKEKVLQQQKEYRLKKKLEKQAQQ
jgi:hypothetical protein